MTEFIHEMFGLSIDHYVAVVAVEVACHVVHKSTRHAKRMLSKLREKRIATKGGADEDSSYSDPPCPVVLRFSLSSVYRSAGQKMIGVVLTGGSDFIYL